jgi:hypothetical protein
VPRSAPRVLGPLLNIRQRRHPRHYDTPRGAGRSHPPRNVHGPPGKAAAHARPQVFSGAFFGCLDGLGLGPGRKSAAGAAPTRWQACARARPSTTGGPQNRPEAPPGLLQTNTRQPSSLCGDISMAVIAAAAAAAAADVLLALKRCRATRQTALGLPC